VVLLHLLVGLHGGPICHLRHPPQHQGPPSINSLVALPWTFHTHNALQFWQGFYFMWHIILLVGLFALPDKKDKPKEAHKPKEQPTSS
jgi:hypothetical protein